MVFLEIASKPGGSSNRASVERKMLRRQVVFALCSVFLVHGMPQDSQAGLPLIQFTNGGIRFNFAGYHAEAGLGGLLGGARTGGGLHASAGTPWGAHAGAGLGGVLSGDDASTGGGLYARAGLGHGKPEAAAGLGGILDGSGRSQVPGMGGLFAGATTGVRGVGVSTGTRNSRPSAPPASEGPRNEQGPANGHTNIQIIAQADKKLEKLQEVPKEEPSTSEQRKPKDSLAHKEIREVVQSPVAPLASASLYGAISLNPVPQGSLVVKTVEKVKGPEQVIEIERAPPAPPLPEANQVVIVEKRPRVKTHSKLVVRKRLWGPRKQVYIDSSVVNNPATVEVEKREPQYSDTNAAPSETTYVSTRNRNDNGFYDDVFNIPISTLNAVNQLLNNVSG